MITKDILSFTLLSLLNKAPKNGISPKNGTFVFVLFSYSFPMKEKRMMNSGLLIDTYPITM